MAQARATFVKNQNMDKLSQPSSEILALKARQYLDAVDIINISLRNRESPYIRGFDDISIIQQVLDCLKLPEGYVLDCCRVGDQWGSVMRPYVRKKETTGTYEYFYKDWELKPVYDPDCPYRLEAPEMPPYSDSLRITGTLMTSAYCRIPDVLDLASYEFNAMTAWEIYLLSLLPSLLPQIWHGLYHKCRHFFSEDDFVTFNNCEVQEWADTPDVRPYVMMNGSDSATVRACFWNDWTGLCVEFVNIFREDGHIHIEEDKDRRIVLVPHECPIRY